MAEQAPDDDITIAALADVGELIVEFSTELAGKAFADERKHGWKGAWRNQPVEWLRASLQEHLDKGDMRDVAILAMFIWKRTQ